MLGLESAPPSPVRLATREDESDLMEMVREMHPEAALRRADGTPLPLSEDMVRSELRRAMVPDSNLPAWIGLVENKHEGGLAGSVYLSAEVTWYSECPVLVERWLYVTPQSRPSRIAAELIDFAKQSANAAGLDLVFGFMSSGRSEAKARLYRRHFGNPMGAYFVYHGAAAGAL